MIKQCEGSGVSSELTPRRRWHSPPRLHQWKAQRHPKYEGQLSPRQKNWRDLQKTKKNEGESENESNLNPECGSGATPWLWPLTPSKAEHRYLPPPKFGLSFPQHIELLSSTALPRGPKRKEHVVIYLLYTLSCLQLSAPRNRICRIIPGVSMMLKRKDFPLVSGRTMVTGVLLIPTPLWNTGKQDYRLKERNEKFPDKRWRRKNSSEGLREVNTPPVQPPALRSLHCAAQLLLPYWCRLVSYHFRVTQPESDYS